MNKPEEGSKEGYMPVIMIPAVQQWDTQSAFYKKIEEDSSQNVDDDIGATISSITYFADAIKKDTSIKKGSKYQILQFHHMGLI